MYPKISIITVVRNDPKGLASTLECLQNLSYSNVEVIVVDGASTDNTPQVAAQYMHSIAKFVSEPDSGIYDAMNKGLRMATGDYVWFINAGDKVINFADIAKSWVSEEPLCDIYYGDSQIIDSSGEVLGLRRKALPDKLDVNALKNGMVVCHQSFIVARAIAPFYDTNYRYSADVQWMIDCIRGAGSICNVGSPISQFLVGGISSRARRSSLAERWSIMRHNFGLVSTVISHIKFAFDAIFSSSYR